MQMSYLSKRNTESLEGFLERSQQLSQETERLFRDWTVHLAGEPGERHRKKFSYEKLQRAFEQEVSHEAQAVSSRQLRPKEFRPVCDEQSESLLCPETDVEHGLHEEVQCQDAVIRSRSPALRCSLGPQRHNNRALLLAAGNTAPIPKAPFQHWFHMGIKQFLSSIQAFRSRRIAQEREEGIRRIQSQVHELTEASIVHEQGNDIETEEHTADTAARETKQAASELRKAADRQRGSRERLCCMLTAAVVLLFLIVLPHMHMSEFRRFEHAPSSMSKEDPAKRI
eukprot:g5063.t1